MSHKMKMMLAAMVMVSLTASAETAPATPAPLAEKATQDLTTVASCKALYDVSLMYFSVTYGAMVALGDTLAAKKSAEIADVIMNNEQALGNFTKNKLVPALQAANVDPTKADELFKGIVKDKTGYLITKMTASAAKPAEQVKLANELLYGMKVCATASREMLGLPAPQPKVVKKTTEI